METQTDSFVFFAFLISNYCTFFEASCQRIPDRNFNFVRKLNLKCSDRPEVMLGREDGANLTTLSPGEDIALKCAVLSSPLHHTILWTKQVRIRSVDLLYVFGSSD